MKSTILVALIIFASCGSAMDGSDAPDLQEARKAEEEMYNVFGERDSLLIENKRLKDTLDKYNINYGGKEEK